MREKGELAMRRRSQVLVIGSGIAGLSCALSLADKKCEVILLNADADMADGNSALAQGGIIYQSASGKRDAKALEKDILIAGHNYNSHKAVNFLCKQGPKIVEEILLDRAPVNFDKNEDGSFNLTREGGHSEARILHKADYTGKAIMDALAEKVEKHSKIRRLGNFAAIDLITTHHHAKRSQVRYEIENRCLGAYALNCDSGDAETFLADYTVLATGGVGQVFLHSTNSSACVGSGISMAYRAGVSLANLEFMQFHPTALYAKHGARRPLITESMRGEGATLLDSSGKPFMQKHDPRGDLAPRDIVAQAMLEEMQHSGAPHLFLDASSIEMDLEQRFPTVFNECVKIGIDIRKEPIPVVPAAHYFCGGILTDLTGRTSMRGLYAIGECACTGLHGANRLASTSLLEGLVWGVGSGGEIAKRLAREKEMPEALCALIPDWQVEGSMDDHDDPALVAQDWTQIRNTMWNYVGISRSTARLCRAFEGMRSLVRNIHEFYKHTRLSKRLVNLFHGAQTAYVITQAAMRNPESAGCHHRCD